MIQRLDLSLDRGPVTLIEKINRDLETSVLPCSGIEEKYHDLGRRILSGA